MDNWDERKVMKLLEDIKKKVDQIDIRVQGIESDMPRD